MKTRLSPPEPQRFMRFWQIPAQFDGMRADLYLTYHLKKISRTKAQKFIQDGTFTKGGLPLAPAKRLFTNDNVELRVDAPDTHFDIAHVKVETVHEDQDILVVNKPPRLAIHPSGRYYHQTLTYWLKQKYGDNYPRPCHRIDRDTSGLVVCAKNKKAQTAIKTAFQQRGVRKLYIAIAQGHLKEQQIINEPLALQGSRGLVRIRMIVDPSGLPCETLVSPLFFDEKNNRTIVACEPKTGRQHQIRAHLAHIGHPIVGDKIYQMGDEYFNDMILGKTVKKPEHFRHALHAFMIEFPLGNESMKLLAPLPSDMQSLIPTELITHESLLLAVKNALTYSI